MGMVHSGLLLTKHRLVECLVFGSFFPFSYMLFSHKNHVMLHILRQSRDWPDSITMSSSDSAVFTVMRSFPQEMCRFQALFPFGGPQNRFAFWNFLIGRGAANQKIQNILEFNTLDHVQLKDKSFLQEMVPIHKLFFRLDRLAVTCRHVT